MIFNSANSNIEQDSKTLYPIYRKEWFSPHKVHGAKHLQEIYIDFGIIYSEKYYTNQEKENIAKQEKEKTDKRFKEMGRSLSDNNYQFTPIFN